MDIQKTTRAIQHEIVDEISLRIYGTTDMTESIYAANPGLADLGMKLPSGTLVNLPAQTRKTQPTTNLWE